MTSHHSSTNSAIVPTPKLEEDFYDWYDRHEAKVREAAARNHDLIFIGDSITHLLEGHPSLPGRGETVWDDCYRRRNALNLGFGWDRTQNVLWRLDHGELAGQTPRLVVLLIGTNNLTGTTHAPTNSPAEVVEGIRAIRGRIATASPDSRILLMGVFPRSTPQDPIRSHIREINTLLAASVATEPSTRFLDIGSRFLDANGTIPSALLSDRVHPTEAGYRIWAEAIEPIVSRVVGPRNGR